MDSLYLETNALLQRIHYGLAEMERAQSADVASATEARVREELEKITANCERLDVLVSKEPVARRRTSKYKVDQLKYDCQHLEAALQQLQNKLVYRWQQKQEREELFSQRYRPNDSTAVYMNDANLEHNDRLSRANRDVDQLIDSGQIVFENMRSQHGALKGVKRKMLDVFQQLGLSNTVLRLIERRTKEDKFILFGGMFVTALIMYFLYRWIRG